MIKRINDPNSLDYNHDTKTITFKSTDFGYAIKQMQQNRFLTLESNRGSIQGHFEVSFSLVRYNEACLITSHHMPPDSTEILIPFHFSFLSLLCCTASFLPQHLIALNTFQVSSVSKINMWKKSHS